MATKIVTKNSSTASAVPTASDLVQGELAVNVADKRLFTEDNGGSIVELGTNPSTIDINAGTIDGAVIGGTTPAAITGSTVTSTGNIIVTGTVDGRDVATDGTKLDGIEAGATANQTAAEIKTAYESNADTNAFTDTDHTKLDGIEASADVTDTTNVVASLTAGSNITIAADGTIASTASGGGETLQQTLAIGNTTTTDTKIQFRDTGLYINSSADGQLDIVADTEVQIAATTVDVNGILDVSGNIVAGGTVDGRDVATDGTKLDGIEASADVTDTANVTAAGAVMDSELTSEASVKALNQGVATTDSPAFAGLTVDTTTLAVDSTNNRVGVGIASPTELLHVSGATDPKILVKATGAGDADADIILDANDTGESGVIFNNSGVKKARIDWSNQNLQLNMATESGTNGTIDFQPNDVLAMRITAAGVAEFKAGITEDSVTLSGTSTTIDLATATNFVHDLTGATTYTFSNPATTGNATAFTLKIIQDSTARAITWPASVDWAGGTAPTLTATNNGVDIFTFFTLDGGTTYYGFTAGQAMA